MLSFFLADCQNSSWFGLIAEKSDQLLYREWRLAANSCVRAVLGILPFSQSEFNDYLMWMLKRGGKSYTQLVLTLCWPHPNRSSTRNSSLSMLVWISVFFFRVREDFRILQSCRVITRSQRSTRLPASRRCSVLLVQENGWPHNSHGTFRFLSVSLNPSTPRPLYTSYICFPFHFIGKTWEVKGGRNTRFAFFTWKGMFFIIYFLYGTFKNRVCKVLCQTSNSRKLRKAILQNKQSTVRPKTR